MIKLDHILKFDKFIKYGDFLSEHAFMITPESAPDAPAKVRAVGGSSGLLSRSLWAQLLGLALSATIPALITGGLSVWFSSIQRVESEDRIRKLIDDSSDFTRLSTVKGGFNTPRHNSATPESIIKCSGWIKNMPKNFHLWIAVEIGSGIYIKTPEVVVDWEKLTWSADISQPPGTLPFNLVLYVASESGHYSVFNFLKHCEEERSYPKVLVDFPGTMRVEHVDNLNVQAKP